MVQKIPLKCSCDYSDSFMKCDVTAELVKVMADIACANSPLMRRYTPASQFALLL